jgi:predicted ArsR family transcriptional regulator
VDASHLLPPQSAAPPRRRRAEVLEMLRAAEGPLGIRDVAERMQLHANTARFHLEALVSAGLAVRETEDRGRPGRPRIGYRAVRAGSAGLRQYRLLAEMLTGIIARAMPGSGPAAEEAGWEWGAYLTQEAPPYRRLTAAEAVGQLAATMDGLGFAPLASPSASAGEASGRYRLGLRQCPFREVAQHHPEIICSLHLGLMRGALARMRAPVTAEGLEPFAEPSLCLAHLTVAEPPRNG